MKKSRKISKKEIKKEMAKVSNEKISNLYRVKILPSDRLKDRSKKLREKPRRGISMSYKYMEKRKERFQKEILPKVTIKKGDMVKVSIDIGPAIESMWFMVLKIKGNKILGQLKNIPLYVGKYKLGDEIWFDKTGIEDAEYLIE